MFAENDTAYAVVLTYGALARSIRGNMCSQTPARFDLSEFAKLAYLLSKWPLLLSSKTIASVSRQNQRCEPLHAKAKICCQFYEGLRRTWLEPKPVRNSQKREKLS
jgi:hypothetical protein